MISKIPMKWAAMLSLAALFISCKKDEDPEVDSASAGNEAVSNFVEKAVSDDEDAVTMKSMMGGGGEVCNWQNYLPECATVTSSSEEFPKTITIDYGDGCTNMNGHVKSGQIIIDLSADMMEEGSVRTVTFQNFYVNGIHVEGSRVVVNTGVNSDGHPTFSRVISTTLTHNGDAFVRNFTGVVTWLSGYDTEMCGDNIFQLEGTGSVVRPNGLVVQRIITEPLILDRMCGYIKQGVVTILSPFGTITVNFGDGTCDNEATVTNPNGETQVVYLGQ